MPEVSSRQERDLFLGRELGQDLVDVKVLVSGRHDGGGWDEVEQYIQYERWRVGDQSESVSNHGGESRKSMAESTVMADGEEEAVPSGRSS